MIERIVCVLLLCLTGCSAQSQQPGCPARCLCFNRDDRMVVRCMFVGLTEIPQVPRDTSILDLRFNRISVIRPGTFTGLTELYTLLLNSNEVEEIPAEAFSGLKNLKYLYLYKNKIKTLSSQAFRGLDKLDQLFLHNNRLRTISEAVLSPIKQLTRLRLDSNPLVCNCDLQWLKPYTNQASQLMEVAATCSEPQNLAGVAITDVSDEDFNCGSRRIVPNNRTLQTNEQTTLSNRIPIDVPNKAPKIRTQPQDVQVKLGNKAYMLCHVEGDPKPKIAWYHNEQEIVSNDIEPSSRYHIYSDGTLMIDDVSVEDQGNYGCMAQNSAGEVVSGPATLLLQSSVVERPEFIQKPKDQTVSLGSSISLTCTATPNADLQWYKDGQPYRLDPRRSTRSGAGTILITDVVSSDAGIYRCSAMIGNEAVHATARVLVREQPYFTDEPDSVSAVEGGVAYFTCEAGGFPKPSIKWIRNGAELTDSQRITLSQNGTSLRISDVTLTDAGKYECEASNALATVSSSAFLTTRKKVSPEIISKPHTISAEQGADAVLTCEVKGDPDPVITWYRDDVAINSDDDDKYQVSSEGALTVNNITLDDAGSYDCQAVNPVGKATATFFIQIIGQSEKIYPGDEFVDEAIQTAKFQVNQAANRTLREFSDRSRPLTSSDLLALFKYPSQGAQQIARSAETFERALEIIIQKVNQANHVELSETDANHNIRELLSPNQIRIIAELSGCTQSRPVIDCSTNMCFHMKYRTLDGTCNNLRRPMLGASLTPFGRWIPAVYENNFNMPMGWNASKLYHGFPKPSARLVSTQIISTPDIVPDDKFTAFLMQWGQFLDHDLTLSPQAISRARFSDGKGCNNTCDNVAPCFPIPAPPGDPRLTHTRCLGTTRSSAACGTGMTSVLFNKITRREQINELTAFVDASNVYGSTESVARDIRDFARGRGLLRTGLLQTTSGKHLLPFNLNHPMDCQVEPTRSHVPCFLAGEVRANEQLALLVIHTLFVREHNRIAIELGAVNPHWDSDMVYHEARKIMGGIMQHISYQHWLPKIIGPVGMQILGEYKGYDPTEDPSIMNSFATAAFRFGHTLINPIIFRFNSTMGEHQSGHVPLHKTFFAPYRLIEEGGVDPVLRGLFGVPGKLPMSDKPLNSELTEKLFKLAHAVALDLASLNIQRGRDHGLPPYNEWRKKCGLHEAHTFDDLANEIPDLKVRMKIEQVYGHPSNIDLFAGAVVEQILPGARVGPTFMCILTEQFRRLRNGDRFYYENPGVFSPEQLAEIKQITLAHIVCMSSDNITEIPKDVFLNSHYPKQYVQCNSGKIPGINFKVWAQCCQNCERSGEFRSITHSVTSRSRRSADEALFSYTDEKPRTQVTVEDYVKQLTEGDRLRKLANDRLEGLEETVEIMSNQINSVLEQINMLREKPCYFNNKEYKNGESWNHRSANDRYKCSCVSGKIECNEVC